MAEDAKVRATREIMGKHLLDMSKIPFALLFVGGIVMMFGGVGFTQRTILMVVSGAVASVALGWLGYLLVKES
jgi:hypothetical protein